MSGICGIVQRDGAPASAEVLQSMVDAMAFWGPEGVATHVAGPVAVARFLVHDTPEDRFDAQPFATAGSVFVCSARLDNREELLREMGIPASAWPRTPDSELLQRAWEKWGEDLQRHISGDWHFAAWEGERQELTLMRDHFGVTSLYYFFDSTRFVFASSIKAILALPFVPKEPNLLRVAQVLVGWMGSGELSGYQDIHALPVAHVMRCSARGMEARRYWDLDAIAPRRWARDEDFFEAFMHTYSAAVHCRLRTDKPVAATLSAGFDSGSVVALAGPLLAEEGRALTAYTSVPLYDTVLAADRRLGNEWDAAHETAVMAGVEDHQALDCADAPVVAAIRAMVETHDTAAHGATNYFWLRRILQTAREQGKGVLLTGQFGNASVSYSGNGMLWHYASRGEWRGLWESLQRVEPNLALAFKRQIAKPLLMLPMSYVRWYMPGAMEERLRGCALRPHLVDELGLRKLLRKARDDTAFHPARDFLPRPTFYSGGMGRGNELWRELAAAHGLSVRDPTADRRLVELCHSAPYHFFRRGGMHRWLLRRLMRGKMPDRVLDYRQKGLQSADIPHRVWADAAAYRVELEGIERHPLAGRALDVPKMRTLLEALGKEQASNNSPDVHPVLCVGLGAGLFLRRF